MAKRSTPSKSRPSRAAPEPSVSEQSAASSDTETTGTDPSEPVDRAEDEYEYEVVHDNTEVNVGKKKDGELIFKTFKAGDKVKLPEWLARKHTDAEICLRRTG